MSPNTKGEPLRYPFPTVEATLITRDNRFVARCLLGEETVSVHVPNTGRMLELMLPGNRVWLADLGEAPERRYRYRLVGAALRGLPVLVESSRANDWVAQLLERDGIPGLEGFRVVAREVRVGHSRIDLELRRGSEELLLEVKSCTFVQNGRGMFPDAHSARATRHLEELAGCGRRAGVLFCLKVADARLFTPHFHVDPEFATTLLELAPRLALHACALRISETLAVEPKALRVELDLESAARHNRDAGAYLLSIELNTPHAIDVGALGELSFQAGHYIYVGSARKGLAARLRRHATRSKKAHWHVDHLLAVAQLRRSVAIRGYGEELSLARSLATLADGSVAGFGATDSPLDSHLFYFRDDPFSRRPFVEWLLDQQTHFPPPGLER